MKFDDNSNFLIIPDEPHIYEEILEVYAKIATTLKREEEYRMFLEGFMEEIWMCFEKQYNVDMAKNMAARAVEIQNEIDEIRKSFMDGYGFDEDDV